ncbi:MAG: hypothetical protein IJH90_06290 [Mogibacterium sp.]|nr:hypothetical protein [Mogibacterium sp.]
MGKSRAANRERLSHDIFKLTFDTDDCRFTGPGQYALIRVGGVFRPYQVCDYDSDRFTIVFKEDGRGGQDLLALNHDSVVETVTGLGNGFDVDAVPDGAVLAADSMGVSEMLELARALLMRGKNYKVVLGYTNKDNIFMIDSFRVICNEIEVVTLDGSNGREGRPYDVIRNADYVCASGSPGMLKELAARCANGQFSLSDMMLRTADEGGDFRVETTEGDKRCVGDGPVFDKNIVVWDTLSLDRWNRSAY